MTLDALNSSVFGSFIPLKKPNPAFSGFKIYDDYIRGTNLVNKAAQLVNDLESARNQPDLDTLLKPPARPILNAPDYFEQLLSDIQAQLKKTDKPLTVLNFLEAQRAVNESTVNDLDTSV